MIDKYLFLDFDGVLNTSRYAKVLRSDGLDLYDEFDAIFDPNSIANLKNIIEQTHCKIVLSTSWRNEGLLRMRSLWKDRNLPGEIFSMTPILLSTTYQNSQNGEMFCIPELNAKALEINAWLQQNASKSFNYVIVDDENVFFQSQQEHLILTDEYDGLTIDKAKLAIEILNR